MDLRKIAAERLKEHGYEGLCSEYCGCKIDDLMPCDDPSNDCKAGHIIPCPGPDICDAYGDCDWHIGVKQSSIVNNK